MARLRLQPLAVLCLLAAPVAAEEAADPAAWPELAEANLVDRLAFARLRELELVPSARSSDAEFLRRLSQVTIGQLPAPADVRAFLADARPDKRARKIDELLAHPLRAAQWATRFSELTGNSLSSLEGPEDLKPKRAKMWHDWLRRRFADNTPYNVLVRGILTATSRGADDAERWIDAEAALVRQARQDFSSAYADRPALDLFWRRALVQDKYPLEELTERVAANFLGVRINCARCHQHPFDRWTQEDYRAFTTVFSQVRFDMSAEVRARLADRIDQRRRRTADGADAGAPLPHLREVYVAVASLPPSAGEGGMPVAKALGGPVFTAVAQQSAQGAAAGSDYRAALMDWLDEAENPFFARNIVNRVWAYHFGRGLVMPLDGHSADNPPAHEALLAELSREFVAHGYELLWLERLLLNSTLWQLSSEPNDTNRHDTRYFSRAYVRIPPAETIVDMWQAATSAPASFGDHVPPGVRAVELGPTRLGVRRWDNLLDLFGRSPRTQTCDCTPVGNPSIRQTLAVMCDTELLGDLAGGELKSMAESGLQGEALVEALFLRTVSRLPTDRERAALREAPIPTVDNNDNAQTRQAAEDLLWGLVNSQEFLTIH